MVNRNRITQVSLFAKLRNFKQTNKCSHVFSAMAVGQLHSGLDKLRPLQLTTESPHPRLPVPSCRGFCLSKPVQLFSAWSKESPKCAKMLTFGPRMSRMPLKRMPSKAAYQITSAATLSHAKVSAAKKPKIERSQVKKSNNERSDVTPATLSRQGERSEQKQDHRDRF